MVAFNSALAHAVVFERRFGRAGSPWEFNLRDVLRWCELAQARAPPPSTSVRFEHARAAAATDAVIALFPVIYLHRLRTQEDRAACSALFSSFFPAFSAAVPSPLPPPALRLSSHSLSIGVATLGRSGRAAAAAGDEAGRLSLLRGQMGAMEAAAAALERGWMVALVGPGGAGKTGVARGLACLAGAEMHEVRYFLFSLSFFLWGGRGEGWCGMVVSA